MKNKRRLTTAILMTIALILQLSGCQLAKDDGAAENTQTRDKLIGVFVTTEPLDLFDMEGYLNDHIHGLDFDDNGNTQVSLDSGHADYSRQLNAVYKPSNNNTVGEYIFEGVDGIAMFQPNITQDGTDASIVNVTQIDPEISDIHSTAGDTNKLEGTIYVANTKYFAIYCNPVYQKPDGSVYLLSGHGISGDLTHGASFSQSLKEDYSSTVDGVSTQTSMEVRVTVEGRHTVDKYQLLEMNADNNCVGTQNISAADIPDSITVHRETDYIIVINEYTDDDGNLQKERQLFDISREDEPHISLFFPYEDPILTEHYINITFEGAA